ncbi:hypothetical protein [Streptomyces vinaceus]|uniref:hypothetical protein n=1 Tax=Streptomyces vinaceus TaxID=1960 RepID=UPI003675B0B6
MEIVAIPKETTICFYAEAGQEMSYGAHQLDRWNGRKPPLPALNSRNVTYNLSLSSDSGYDEELRNKPELGGHKLILPGKQGIPDPVRLCEGTPAECPSHPRQIRQGWQHNCLGLLGRLQGELHWLACIKLPLTDETEVALAGMPRSVLLGQDPYWTPPATRADAGAAPSMTEAFDWAPNAADLQAIAKVNAFNVVDSTPDVSLLHYAIRGDVLLVGGTYHFGQGHDPGYVAHMTGEEVVGGYCQMDSDGVFHIDLPWSSPHRPLVQAAFAQYSDEAVRFDWAPY